MYTVYVKKDSSATIPVQKATIEEVDAFCAGRDDVVDIKDADGNTVSFASQGENVQLEAKIEAEFMAMSDKEARAIEEVEAAPAPTE